MAEAIKEYDVIVIGAGPNGLCCGAYLAKAGAKTLVLEKKNETGGGLSTDDFQTPFRFNLHAIYMLLAEIMPAHTDLELESNNVSYLRPETQLAFHYEDGKALVFYLDPKKSVASISQFSGEDAKAFEKMYGEFKQISDEILIPATYVPPIPVLENLKLLNQTDLGKRCVEISEMTPEEIIDSYGFKDPRVKAALMYLGAIWGLSPDATSVGYLVPLWVYRMMNAAIVRGGSHTLASGIHNAVKLNGGKVLDWANVQEITVDNGAATGVKLEDGREFRAKAIISTLNPEQTFIDLVGEKHLHEDFVAGVKKWQWESWSFFTAHFGIKGNPPEYKAAKFNPDVNSALINVFGYESPEDIKKHIEEVEAGGLGDPAGHLTCTTIFDPHQASRLYGPLHTLRYETWAPYEINGKAWDDVKKDFSTKCYEKLQKFAPNLREAIVLFDFCYSPLDTERRLIDMKRGSIKQGAYNAFQMGYLRPNEQCSAYRTPVKGLYLGGSSVYPGGTILLGSGYNAAKVVAEDLGLSVWWTPPDYVVKAQEKGYIPKE